MAETSTDTTAEVELVPTPSSPTESRIERSPKLRTRQRILKNLQRISSSQSINRSRSSSGYKGLGRGSASCISLSSTSVSSYNQPWSPDVVPSSHNGYSTAPTSVPGTPGQDISALDASTRIRFVSRDSALGRPQSPLTAPMPVDAKALWSINTPGQVSTQEDYFSRPVATPATKVRTLRENFNFWNDLPVELRMQVLGHLLPRELVRCSAVSKSWRQMCFDGQLWTTLDTGDYYRQITPEGLAKVLTYAGPFIKDLNMRGCVQLTSHWRELKLADGLNNLVNISLEGCKVSQNTIHSVLLQNPRLVHVNLCGLSTVSNTALSMIANRCPKLEYLNVSWCHGLDARGVKEVVKSCNNLRDLRISEIRGIERANLMQAIFEQNTLERLILSNSASLNDDCLKVLVEGANPELDFLTGRSLVPARRLKHLDISHSINVTDDGLRSLAFNMPNLEGLQLSKCQALTDSSLIHILPTFPKLTHLDLEELELITNAALQELAKAPCKDTLQHLSVSYCETVGDVGMLPLVKAFTQLRSLDLDNTRISDLVLAEAAAMVKQRCLSSPPKPVISGQPRELPTIGLRMAVYDCQNVTWTGIREVMSRNAERRSMPNQRPFAPEHVHFRPQQPQPLAPMLTPGNVGHDFVFPPRQLTDIPPTSLLQLSQPQVPSLPHEIITLKVFYGYQPTMTEHTKRVLRGDLAAAARLERKWATYMVASEEAGASAVGLGLGFVMGNRRRRRRAREAQMMHADEEEGGESGGVGRRRRARSGGGCLVM